MAKRLIPVAGHRPDPVSELETAVRSIAGHPLTAEARKRFSRYLELLMTWNRTHRLTGLDSPRDIVQKLFRDSLLFLALIPPRPVSLIDLGAGAGIPGMPLRIVDPGISLTLVESRRKPVSFLLGLKRELGLDDVHVIHGRAEAIIEEYPDLQGKYDVVVTRAVRLSHPFVISAMSYLRRGGVLIASGPPPAEGGRESRGFPSELQLKKIEYPALAVTRRFLVGTMDS